MTVHRTVRRGYGACSDAYERARPGYPPQAVAALTETLGIGPGRCVLELGAGTGKFTRALRATAALVVAAEPVAEMRGHLAAALAGTAPAADPGSTAPAADLGHSGTVPSTGPAGAVPESLGSTAPAARVVGATAEAIPLAAGSVDAVVAATAFHWFRGAEAVTEIARVLRPRGGVGLVWNNPDLDCDWVARVWELVGSKRGEAPRNRDLRWKEAFEQAAMFSRFEHRRYAHREQLGVDDLLARVASISFVATLPPREREELLDRVREIAATHPALRGRERFEMPYVTDVYTCHKLT